MALITNGGENGTSGVAVANAGSGGGADTAFTTCASSGTKTVKYSNAFSMHGAQSFACTGDGTSGDLARIGWQGYSATSMAVHGYIYAPTVPTAATQFMNLRSTSAGVALVTWLATGALQVQNAAGAGVYTTTTILSASTWYRVELLVSSISATTCSAIR